MERTSAKVKVQKKSLSPLDRIGETYWLDTFLQRSIREKTVA
jgi:hypothetical protein